MLRVCSGQALHSCEVWILCGTLKTVFFLLSRDQYLFKNRPTDGPPNSFYRSLYPKIIQNIEVGVLICPICRTDNGADFGVPQVVIVGAVNLCHYCSWDDVKNTLSNSLPQQVQWFRC